MERQISISDMLLQRPIFPSLGSKFGRVKTVEVGAAMHVVDHETDAGAFAEEDGGRTVRTAATGDEGGFGGDADVYWDGGVEAEGWKWVS